MNGIYKCCYKCHQYYESILGTINTFCPQHQAEYEKWLLKCVRERNIPIQAYDVYIKTIETDQSYFHHVCRQCGAPILTKKGEFWVNARSCRKHPNPTVNLPSYVWGIVQFNYIQKMKKKQAPRKIGYVCTYLKQIKAQSTDYWHFNHIMNLKKYCEECDALVDHIEIHHTIPVYLLTINNWQLAFDSSNLKGLCRKCHSPKHTEVRIKVGRDKAIKNNNLRAYLKRRHELKDFHGTIATNLTPFLKKD